MKPILKSIGDSNSPNLPRRNFQIKDLSKSPKFKRDTKSQLFQNLTPKSDNLKLLLPENLNTNDMNSSVEKSDYETEKKSEKELAPDLEVLSVSPSKSPVIRLREESLSSPTDTSRPFQLFIQSRSGSKTGYELLENENLEYLQNIIKSQTSAYETLEKNYCSDTNSLKREIEKQRGNCRRFEGEILNLKTRMSYFTSEIEDLNKKIVNLKKENEEKLRETQLDISNRDSEILKLSEMIKKVKLDRKAKEEVIKDLQREVNVLTSCNKILENDINSTKKVLSLTQENLETEKVKSQLVDSQNTENTKLRILNNELEDKLKDISSQLQSTNRNFKAMQSKYNTIKEELEEKDEKLFKATSICPDNPPVRPSLRRMFTLSSLSPSDDSQKENLNRLYQRIAGLEEELNRETLEREKVNRNFEYTKKIVEEKNQIISTLELKLGCDKVPTEDEEKKNSLRVGGLIDKCKSVLKEIQSGFTCFKCKVSTKSKFISLSCGHMFCKECAKEKDSCLLCCNGMRLIKFSNLTKISAKVNQVLDLLINLS